ncbi:MAG TPA: choice-of-anchor D domain-containing protein, partial [Terriglobia bacterium]|nr:choice-of-anchor D domain-containing protein [Terriglobia bacterium]
MGGTLLLLSLLVPGWSAFAQTTLTPATLAFGNQVVNISSASKTATLTNTQAVPLTISSIAITGGTSPADYVWGGSCPLSPRTLGPGKSCSIKVTLTPSAVGADNGTLSVTDDASSSPQTVALTGTSVVSVYLSVTSLSFGNVGENSPSSSKNIVLHNNQAVALTLSGITLSNPDYTETNNCKGSVAKGGYCTITVTLTPSVLGADNGTLSVTDNASNGPQTATLTGTGTLPVTFSLTSLSFGSVGQNSPSTSKKLTLYNKEGEALTISGITLSNPDYTETNTCKGSVGANGNCVITVTFTPRIMGADNGSLNITDTASNSPQTLSLSGTGTAPVDGLSPTSLAFGNQPVGTSSTTQTATLSNTGNAALTLTSIALTGANPGDFAQTNTCGASVAAGASCTISVTFTPAASGTRTATVTLTDNAAGSPQTISLTGTGTAAVASLSPSSLTFTSQALGTTTTAQTITLNNTGNAALSLTSIALTGTNASDFAQTNTCGSSVAASANCAITVTFTPSVTGTEAASLSISDNASGSPQTMSLTGAGINPQPSLTSLSPASAGAGAAAQTLTINGTNFLSTSTVTYNGVAHTPTWVSSTQLTITLSTSDQATAGTYAVVVTNPAPGGGTSNSVSFAVNNALPTTTTLSPTSATAGAAAQTLTINGTNFLSASTVTYN